MENNVTQRVKEIQKAMAMSENRFSQTLNMKQNTLNKQLSDGGSGVSITTALLILDAFPNVSAEWLMRGNGSMFIDDKPQKTIILNKTNEELLAHIRWLEELVDDLRGKQRKEKTA